MTILERKAEFIRQILTDPDDSNFERLEQYFNNIKTQRAPGQETVEEMREGVRRATRKYYDGKKGYITHEEMLAQFKR